MKRLLIASLICAVSVGSYAKDAGFQLSLTPDIALEDRNTTITGASVGVWNENSGTQWQIGFVNGATGDSVGLQWGLFIPTFFNYAENFTGAQLGMVNYVSEELTGAQLGWVNIANSVNGGFQWGIVNYAESAKNLFQLGLVNIIADNEWFTDFPSDLATGFVFVNWTFGD